MAARRIPRAPKRAASTGERAAIGAIMIADVTCFALVLTLSGSAQTFAVVGFIALSLGALIGALVIRGRRLML